jgi:formylglycine-generating enzyme required for sulfatase activity
MVWIPPGEFTMGTDDPDAPAAERPARRVRLSGFFMDQTDVTNAQFRRFVQATGYVTTAQRKVDWEEMKKQLPPGTPRPPDDRLRPGSLVFAPPNHAVSLDDPSKWWSWAPGADWEHPGGPGTSIQDDHPVVQVSWEDARAYAKWAGKSLPTEAQWEYAARGGLAGKRYFWGDDPVSDNLPRCNIWHGRFPDVFTGPATGPGTSPVKTFPANGYGLYDMAGNVWQWCQDEYRPNADQTQKDLAVNPRGPDGGRNLADPGRWRRALRGGSFLCAANYCCSYRITARQGASPDTGMPHVGFRCVR